ncbi:MAG: hypothetical protein R3279_03850 [Putridiphycobacter sp.]|nr:hypothetical protein [Putridiphycobacter sp.]
MKQGIILVMLMLTSTFTFAQSKKVSRTDLQEEKQAFITKALKLTEAEAVAFWPVYEAYEKEMQALRLSQRKIKQALKNAEILSDNEKYNLTEKLLSIDKKEANVKLKYLELFSQKIGKGKAAAVFKAEDDFKRVLFKKLKNMPPPPPDAPEH